MEINRYSTSNSEECDGHITNKPPQTVPGIDILKLDIDGRWPINGWRKAEGVTILRIIRKFAVITSPDDGSKPARLSPFDQVTLARGDEFALNGTAEVLVITATRPDDEAEYVI